VDGGDVDGETSSRGAPLERREGDAAAGGSTSSSSEAYGPNEGGGRGGGGGGAQIPEWSNKGDADKMSMLDITGGAIINSLQGLTLVGGGGASISIQNGKITLIADSVEILSAGETKVTGAPIRLN
jgi:hypothetical protein